MWSVLLESLLQVQYPGTLSRVHRQDLSRISQKSLVFKETNLKKSTQPAAIALVLGRPGWLGEMLRFPIRVGLTWSDRVKFQPPGTANAIGGGEVRSPSLGKDQDTKGRIRCLQTGHDYERTERLPSPGPAQKFGPTLTTMLPMSKLLFHLIRPEAFVWRRRLSISAYRNKTSGRNR